MDKQQAFVEEIEYSEIQFLEVVGKGAFGVVSRAVWHGIIVAVKLIETESERKAFITELKQLSRVNHPNIVKLYGASTKLPQVCLVMEYAEGGSLYNVLHGTGNLPNYTAAHAMSWALQCARGVEYLHGMKPKPLVHRDLKPPNLLLVSGGTVLKICDFGTACDAHTHMTNNKGSAAWMAPEVFEGNNYSEKCDVFSWGIILWEVITRRKPFDEIGGPAFRIMWAVHSGTRPPLIKNCPKPIELLMTRCWCSNPVERPSMSEVARIMTRLFQFFNGADEPLCYPTSDESSSDTFGSANSTYDNAQYTSQLTGPMMVGLQIMGRVTGRETPNNTTHDTIREHAAVSSQIFGHINRRGMAIVTGGATSNHESGVHSSAPASLRASQESLPDQRTIAWAGTRGSVFIDPLSKRFSADLSILSEAAIMQGGAGGITSQVAEADQTNSFKKHRRTGSHGTPFVPQQPTPTAAHLGHRRAGSFGNATDAEAIINSVVSGTPNAGQLPHQNDDYMMRHTTTAPANLECSGAETNPLAAALRSLSWAGASYRGVQNNWPPGINGDPAMMSNLMYTDLNHQLQPIPPCSSSPESMAIYQNHCKLAEEYLKMQSEIIVLTQRKKELTEELEQEDRKERLAAKLKKDYTDLLNDNDELKVLQSNLQQQVEQIKNRRLNPHSSVL